MSLDCSFGCRKDGLGFLRLIVIACARCYGSRRRLRTVLPFLLFLSIQRLRWGFVFQRILYVKQV